MKNKLFPNWEDEEMRNEELRIKYQALFLENEQLKEEIKKLKASLGGQFLLIRRQVHR